MPIAITNISGDGVNDVAIRANIELPDAGSSVLVQGSVAAPGKALQSITGSPLTAPAPPGSGSIFWNIQVDVTTGAATVQQSTVSDPAPLLSADAVTPQQVIFRQTLVPSSSADLVLDPSATPDQPV